jgi:hypothetical protein
MKRLAGQAGRTIGWLIHHTGMILMTVFLVLALAVGGFAYRLSLGPLQIPWLTSRLANIVSGQGINIHITRAALAWGGYKSGGSVPLFLQLGGITASNAAGVELAEIPSGTLVFQPGALFGSQAPILVSSTDAVFAGSTVPVSLKAAFRLGGFFTFSSAELFITLGSGVLDGGVPVAGGGVRVDITPDDVTLSNGNIRLKPVGASAPVIGLTGTGHRDGAWHGTLTITADEVHADDLAAYWPADLAAQTRSWVVANITIGTASAGKFTFGLSAPSSLSTLNMDSAGGGFLGDNLSVGWIPHAQPITGVTGKLTLNDKDSIDITADTGSLGGLGISAAHMRIIGMTTPEQTSTLTIPVTGTVQDTLRLLNTPPLTLLRGVPPQLPQATGMVAGTVNVSLPLKGDVTLDEVNMDVQAALTDVAAPTPFADVAFSGGTLAVQATTKRLDVKGTAQLAGETASIAASAQFKVAGPDVAFNVETTAGNGLLRPFGLEADPGLNNGITGVVPISLAVKQAPSGKGSVTLRADLTKAAVGAPAAGWAKAAGVPGRVDVAATINNGTVTGITVLSATAPDLDITGATDPADANRLNLTRLHVAETEAAGSIVAPPKPGGTWRVTLAGPRLNITAILNPPPKPASARPAPPPAKPGPPSGPLWMANLRFDTFVMAGHGAPALHGMVFTGDGQGSYVYSASGTASGDAGQSVHLKITRSTTPQAEDVHLDGADAGFLFQAIGAYNDIKGGALVLDAHYKSGGDTKGVLTLEHFRLLQAPAFGKVLQGLTVYGIPEATSGPGLIFDRLVAPFSIGNNVLTLEGARAFSASLGFTASGTVGLVDGSTDLDTTIIPAYALNAALGRIPIIGGLFSAEKGGGLIAVRARITGQLTAPKISINPLSALTPGFLRDVFGVGETHAAPAAP